MCFESESTSQSYLWMQEQVLRPQASGNRIRNDATHPGFYLMTAPS